MENSIQFNKKPFHGVFAEAAKRLKLRGENARIIVRNSYRSGNRSMVKLINEIIEKRIAEEEKNRESLEKFISIQNPNTGGV